MSAVSGTSEKDGESEDVCCAKESEKKERDVGALSGMGEKKKSGMSAMSNAGDGIVRSRGSGDTAREAARGRAGHVELQGGSSGTIPLFPMDENFIRPDHGNQEVSRYLESSDDFWTCLSRPERPPKGLKIRPTFDPGGLEARASQVGLTVEEVGDTRSARSMICTRDGQIRNLLAFTTDESIPASRAVAIDSVNTVFESASPSDAGTITVPPITEVVFPEDDLAQCRSGNQSLASRIFSRASNEGVKAGKGENVEPWRREFELWKEWEPGETTREQLEQLKGQERLLCLAGVDGLNGVFAVALLLGSEAVRLGTVVAGTGMGPCPRHRSKA